MTEAEVKQLFERELKKHPALAESLRLREVARRDVMQQLRHKMGADVAEPKQPQPARIEYARLKNRLLQNAAPTRESIRNQRKRMCAARPWLDRYSLKTENLLRMYAKRQALEAVIDEEGITPWNRHYFAMYVNLSKLIQVEERDLGLTPVAEVAMKAHVARTEIDVAALLAQQIAERNGHAIEDQSDQRAEGEEQ